MRLEVYRRSYSVALDLQSRLGREERCSDVVRQLCRAARSIPANIAEGVNVCNSAVETRRFLGIASRSCDEVRVWLDFCRDLELAGTEDVDRWHQEYCEIGAMLLRLWQRWERHELSHEV